MHSNPQLSRGFRQRGKKSFQVVVLASPRVGFHSTSSFKWSPCYVTTLEQRTVSALLQGCCETDCAVHQGKFKLVRRIARVGCELKTERLKSFTSYSSSDLLFDLSNLARKLAELAMYLMCLQDVHLFTCGVCGPRHICNNTNHIASRAR